MGLEDILARIRSDAEQKASAILEDGELEKREALSQYRAELEAFYGEEMKKLAQRTAELEQRMSFHVRKEAERELASARRALMDQAISAAVTKLSHLDDSRYLALVAGLIGSVDLKGEVAVVISKSDEGRITREFLDSISKPGLNLRLSSERHGLERGGVVLRGDGVSVNATFAMVARLAHEELIMELAKSMPGDTEGED